jgi:cell division protein FtsL
MVHRKFSRKQIVAAAAVSLGIIAVLSFYLWHLTENVRLGYAISLAQNAIQRLDKDVMRLKTQRTALLSLDRVERIARERLGLTDPRKDQVLYEAR